MKASAVLFAFAGIVLSCFFGGGVFRKGIAGGAAPAADFAGGDGSAENPFLIASAAHLDNVRDYKYKADVYKKGDRTSLSGYYFRLTADIDLRGYTEENYPDGGWKPIGTVNPSDPDDMPFCGTVDGGGRTVSGLWVDRDEEYAGLFGEAYASSFYGLDIIFGEKGVTGRRYAGGLAGRCYGENFHDRAGSIERCRVTGSVSLKDSEAYTSNPQSGCGGIAGFAYNSSVSEACFTGVLSGENMGSEENAVAGIIGTALDNVALRNCYAQARIVLDEDKPSVFAAGLAVTNHVVTAINCYAAVASDSPAAPTISEGRPPFFGSWFLPTAISVYYCDDMILNGAAAIAGVTGLSPSDMKRAASYKDWDFESVWHIDEGKSAPELIYFISEPHRKPLGAGGAAAIAVGGAALFALAAFAAVWFGARRKSFADLGRGVKSIFVKEKEVVKEVPVEVIREVPVTEGRPLPMSMFTPAERRVAEHLLLGKSRSQIAEKLGIGEETVKMHTHNILDKAEVGSQKAFIAKYIYDKNFFEES